ncbi:SRPBCC family protein [Rothia nasimurium]|uniref:Polyketide cyclase n=1 Tax=Luteibacter anthropi TaxID=564369 RepID=A0A7X5ZJU4_9GAMM|nr:polyketide cyclase [Luteibacter anthropi]NII08373.1 polyketide cyclase [Luteibacter anthropi]
MTRLLEFIVAILIVAVLGVVVGVAMPSTGHVEREMLISKDLRQVYDVFSNFRRFPDYTVLRTFDPKMQFELSGKAYGPGAKISWKASDPKIGDGSLEIASIDPSFAQVTDAGKGTIVWNLDNNWRGHDKTFTIKLERTGRSQKLVKVNWSYDVAYGWNLVDRFSNLYIHGDPDALIQFSLTNLQNVMAAIPNIDYSKMVPSIAEQPAKPILFVSTTAPRTLDDVDTASDKAMAEIQAAAKKLGVNIVSPRITFTTNWGDQNYTFDVAAEIDATTLKINGQDVELTAAQRPALDAAAPAEASTAAAPAADNSAPGSKDKLGRVIVDGNVKAVLAFGGKALKADWNGTGAGLPQTRQMLAAYSQTHGYKFDDVTFRPYDIQVKAPTNNHGTIEGYDEQKFEIYLPLQGDNVPDQTPEQEAGMKQPGLEESAPAASSTAPAAAGTAPAPASTAAK